MTASAQTQEDLIYLDHAGSSPVRAEILNRHAERVQRFVANPHASSRASELGKRAGHEAEHDVLEALGLQTDEAGVIWTSGGTEAANLATLGRLRQHPGSLALVDAGAHPALLEPCRHYARREGGHCVEIPLDERGGLALDRVDPAAAAAARVVAVTQVNNETGAVIDLEGLAAWMRRQAPAASLVVDAAQAFGKVPVPWRRAGIDLLVISGRKLGGPAAAAALVVRREVRLEPLLYGGGQQGGTRPGTLDVVGIVELAQAVRLAAAEQPTEAERVAGLKARLVQGLATGLRPTFRVLSPVGSSPWIVCLAIPGYEGAIVMRALAERGVVVGTGSACSAESGKTSHVLRAMGVPESLARCVLRVSFGRETTPDHVDALLRELAAVLRDY